MLGVLVYDELVNGPRGILYLDQIQLLNFQSLAKVAFLVGLFRESNVLYVDKSIEILVKYVESFF